MKSIEGVHVDPVPFTDDAAYQWGGNLGPVWLLPPYRGARLEADQDVSLGLYRFLESVQHIIGGEIGYGRLFAYGTAYATKMTGDPVPAGTLHYDGGRYNPYRNIIRVTGVWSSDETPLSNVFMPHRDAEFEQRLSGKLVSEVPADFYFQPANNHAVAFDEGLDLHGRAPAPARPCEWGVFCSATLYLEGQDVDLHCPRLRALEDRTPDWIPLLTDSERHY